jgi:hypothetical protein
MKMVSSMKHVTEIGIMEEGKDTDIHRFEGWLPIFPGEILYIFDTPYMVINRVFAIVDEQLSKDTWMRTGILSLNVKGK